MQHFRAIYLSLAVVCATGSGVNAKDITLKIDQQKLGIIVNALIDRPFKEVAGVLGDIQTQVSAQNKPMDNPPGGNQDNAAKP